MRFVWAWGALTAWLVVPFGMWAANAQGSYGIIFAGLLVGGSGVLASYWALCTLIYRMLKAGDRIEAEEEEREEAASAEKGKAEPVAAG
jgi:hypothetical protein